MSVNNTKGLTTIIAASSVGTLIEWYDFYIFGSLATIISTQFFPQTNPTAAFLSTLATFAAGFVVRPFGALFFGRLGDLIGRKYTFLVTLVIMGLSTFLIGCIPSFSQIGYLAPALVLILRLLQGLALGGEYGGAATYVAEHSPAAHRGFWTSWIQTTATLGLFLSLVVILLTRKTLGVESFEDWGWRVPFLLSIVMVAISYIIRKRMSESPVFLKVKAEGKISTNPLKESFGEKYNFKYVLLALFGATMGQGVIWYTGQFYALSFIQKVCNIEFVQSNYIVAIALAIGTPLFVIFGSLSDRYGRKWIMLSGILLGVICYRPIYEKMFITADISEKMSKVSYQKIVNTIPSSLNGSNDSLYITTTSIVFADSTSFLETKKETKFADNSESKIEVKKATNLNNSDFWTMVFLVAIQLVFVAMAYGPIAAFLVELFPTKIRYTSMSLPYHIGNGIFGGLMPFMATFLVEISRKSGESQPYLAGLWYPIIIGAVTVFIGAIFIKENKSKHD
ncbi:MAG: MFS transporter [Bacteroidota bacterium]